MLRKVVKSEVFNSEEWKGIRRANETWKNNGGFLPFLMVRFEDVLFNPGKLATIICDCLGGERTNKTRLLDDPSKDHGQLRNRVEALAMYGDVEYRYEGLNKETLSLWDKEMNNWLMNFFRYKVDLTRL